MLRHLKEKRGSAAGRGPVKGQCSQMEVTVLDERVSTRSNSLTSEAGTNWAPYLQMN